MSTSAVNQSQIPPGGGPSLRGPGPQRHDILPTLFGGPATYPVRPNNFVLSFLLHVLAMSLVLLSGIIFVKQPEALRRQVSGLITDISPYLLPPAATQAGGGGGGGDRDKLAASKGSLPKFAREQFTPPAAVIRNDDPKLPIEATVVVPPEINIPRNQGALGDPMQGVLGASSSGTGYGGGIGSGSGGGVGSGRGPGVGPGWGGGIGGGPYRVGGGVSAPRAIFQPDPEYSEEARKAKYQGTVVLWVVIGPDGRTHDIRVQRSLGLGLDEKAMQAVRTWKFEPARKDGQPVAVQVNIEVNFRLY